MKRLVRNNLNSGYAIINDKLTNEDKTKKILNSDLLKNTSTMVSLKKVAEQGGFERVYTNIYGFISMTAHGKAFNLKTEADVKNELYASMGVVLGALQCTEFITADWIINRKRTPIKTLLEMLNG